MNSFTLAADRNQNSNSHFTKTKSNTSSDSKRITSDELGDPAPFIARHIGPNAGEVAAMLESIQVKTIDTLIDQVVPREIRMKRAVKFPEGLNQPQSETGILGELKKIAEKNEIYRSLIGQGFSDTITPTVILRNVLENPGWYTQYTPYQAEIAQGRLEALLNFQTLTMELTGLPVANASLLDEATACAEAMSMCFAMKLNSEGGAKVFLVSDAIHPQNLEVLKTRAEPIGIQIQTFDSRAEVSKLQHSFKNAFAILFQYPDTWGSVDSAIESKIKAAKENQLRVVVAADPLALVLLKSPGQLGADVAIGSFQRFGVPMGFGGPHAAYLGCAEEFKRNLPGRIVGVSKDARGKPAIRLALQTREQHIRREKATSNICTSQVLLAVMASMYAIYHGPEGLRKIARRIHGFASLCAKAGSELGLKLSNTAFFDTISFDCGSTQNAKSWVDSFAKEKINIRQGVGAEASRISLAFDEQTDASEVAQVIRILSQKKWTVEQVNQWVTDAVSTGLDVALPQDLRRSDTILNYPVFQQYHSEHEMLRYLSRLEKKDLSLNYSMIPLGSCTMKLNSTTEMIPVTWPEFGKIHPAAPLTQAKGYLELFENLEAMLSELTGFDAVSLQPNAGSQGEYSGLLAIRHYHESRNDSHRNVCLIPKSAHGTNPASAVMAGMKVIVVECDTQGNVDVDDLRRLATQHKNELSCLMVTYPSTHGVFESRIQEICQIVHDQGGQVYMDGANMNAQIGLCRPGDFGPDVCHLNLHKTFCIPHGGGGPGMGPIGVKKHLAKFLPGDRGGYSVSGSPWGSASILPISYSYIRMMGGEGLTDATRIAILNANYMAEKLNPHFPVLYRGENNRVAHECIIDLRPLKISAGIEVEDVAKRLMDYGYHAPTVSFPVAGTMMIEPTESESKAEMDRFIEAMISIRNEIRDIESGKADKKNNVLKNAPHTQDVLIATEWTASYSREQAAFPLAWVRDRKFWPSVSRIDGVFGDRNLVCSCAPISDYA